MLRKNCFFAYVFALMFVSACSFSPPQEEFKVPESIQSETTEISDEMLSKTANSLSEKYAQKPKNETASVFQNLSLEELQERVSTEINLDNLADLGAIQIGDDVYFILTEFLENSIEKFTIYKNNAIVHEFSSESLATYSPLINVRVIDNKYTVEYIEKSYDRVQKNFLEKKKIWQDGVGELTQSYQLQNAISPYEANGKLVFLAQKNDKWFVMFDGKRISTEFERIDFGYCCEPAKYMPKAFNYRYYTFFATQDAKQKLIEVDLGE